MTPKFRQVLYTFGVVAFAALTVLSTFKIIDPNVAASVSAAVTAVLGLFGVTVSGTAAYHVAKQQSSGSFDHPSPADQVISGVNQVIVNAQNAQADVQKVRDAVTQAVKDVPVLGPLAQQAIDALPK